MLLLTSIEYLHACRVHTHTQAHAHMYTQSAPNILKIDHFKISRAPHILSSAHPNRTCYLISTSTSFHFFNTL